MSARAIREILMRFTAWFRRGGWSPADTGDEPPLRSELFSADQIEQYGSVLAAAHVLGVSRTRNPLITRLADNESVLLEACRLLTMAMRTDSTISPAGNWLLDNFYLIEDQIRTARRHLPKGYSWQLPRLGAGPSAGLPRVYDIALEIISHGDGRVDPDSLGRFIAAYQSVTTLALGELWGLPIMLRLALIENLRRVATRIIAHRNGRDLADVWADQILETARTDPKSLILVIADMARSNPPMSSSFVAELARRLQGQSPALSMPLKWVEQRLGEMGLTIEQLVQSENQQQASDQVTMSNSIGSLRSLAATDWHAFVENTSAVEHALRQDPADWYSRMDFASRDQYRHGLETIARYGDLPEEEIARLCVELAREGANRAAREGGNRRAAHVGFYLVDGGLSELEALCKVRLPAAERLRRVLVRAPLLFYLGPIALLTTLFAAGLIALSHAGGARGWLLVLTGALVTLGASQLAVSLVNWLVTLVALPKTLPRIDLSKGIPPASKTLVVIPTMLSKPEDIEGLVESLEVCFLGNRDDNLYFGLLTDFVDATEEVRPQDEPLLQLAAKRIAELNEKYAVRDVSIAGSGTAAGANDDGAGGGGSGLRGDTFFLFHRPRQWNPRQRAWMGRERKRGKLADLNALLRGGVTGPFSRIVGAIAPLSDVRYVITLDTDTQLPRDAARQLIGTMSHPLNHACYDAAARRVTQGYGILQPRVAMSLAGTDRSRYAQLMGEEPGIDPYTRTVSDVYQDLFGEGSFIGKGIYDVDAIEQALQERFPDDRVLSHDLLEGCYARSGLVSDAQCYEHHPARYSADVSRRHRWIRGDWQVASWLNRRVPGPQGRTETNPLSALSQWKLFDNLRRSLVSSALTLLLLLGWTVLPSAALWTLAVLAVIFVPAIASWIQALLQKSADTMLSQHLAASGRSLLLRVAQALFTLACLPFDAYFSLGAILRTCLRVVITRRYLLEWVPSAASGDRARDHAGFGGLLASYRSMWISPLLSIATTIALLQWRPDALVVAAPVLALWLAAPWLAWWLSRPLVPGRASLDAEQLRFLRMVSRRTWAFFETFVGPDDHWLPPDNFQEYPTRVVAHRTSPTNMGLALLANLSAHDFGYLPGGRFLERMQSALATMQSLERHRGHFYNWYDTRSLQPLLPIYISTVDSGNLAGHLLTLRPGLAALADQAIISGRWVEGIDDALGVLRDACKARAAPMLQQCQSQIDLLLANRPATLAATREALESLAENAARMIGTYPGARRGAGHHAVAVSTPDEPDSPVHAEAVLSDDAIAEAEMNAWARTLARQCREWLEELALLAPWLWLPPIPPRLVALHRIDQVLSLREVAGLDVALQPAVEQYLAMEATDGERAWLLELTSCLAKAGSVARSRMTAIDRAVLQLGEMTRMEYDFLYDKARHLLAIGYNMTERRRDSGFYDLLASEARLSLFVTIAQGQLPQQSWFALGRLLTNAGSGPTLLSWSGSMFEYLMPLVVMPSYENTLLDESCRAAVRRQIEYGAQRGVPWGMSESGYNMVDAALNYQYRAFGVPGLGLKRGLSEDLVVAPYASALALMVAPEEACRNLQLLAGDGYLGKYGFYEAIDYTPSRVRHAETSAVVRSFMAHHQGMSLLALSHLLLDRPMQRRFAADPLFQTTLLLLQERVPQSRALYSLHPERVDYRPPPDVLEMPVRIFGTPDTRMPAVQLLSNGRYQVMLTNAGGGYSRWKDIAVTRWREDGISDNWGAFCYLRDVTEGSGGKRFWSGAYQPTRVQPKSYEAVFTEQRVEFRRKDADFETHTEIVVSPEDDIELRRVSVVNRSRVRKSIEVTSYAEVVLAPAAADALHPAFGNLFVQTEIIPERHAILCTRRPRSRSEHPPWMLHLMVVRGADSTGVSYETDRARFVGRGNTPAHPQALRDSTPLSGSQGAVLDPIVAIRRRITLDPEQTVTLDLVTGIAESREACLQLVEKYQDNRLSSRAFQMSWTHSLVALRQINVSEADAQLFGRLASAIIYASAWLRADSGVIAMNRRGQSGLWGYGISGDLPIVLVQIREPRNIELVRQLVHAHAYWRLKGLAVDLVIWNEERGGYRQPLHEQIMGLIPAGAEDHVIDRPGGIYVRSVEQISNEDRILLQSVARAVFTDSQGSLADQIKRRLAVEPAIPLFAATRARSAEPPAIKASVPRDLVLANGIGGFAADGREYVITTARGALTPAPWSNVLANPHFGSVITESGSAYSWSDNAHEFRLTPWHNDPVCDRGGEVFYLRDEETGHYWSPTPFPCPGKGPYVSRHGFGYSVFEHTEDGIRTELWVYVDLERAAKFTVLKVFNASGRPRRLSATGYVEWVLGDLRAKSSMHVVTEIDANSGALLARNTYNPEFAGKVAFFDVDELNRTISGDRAEFIGRNGSLRNPAALSRARLSGRVGAALDPCAAIQVGFDLAEGKSRELIFRMGVGRGLDDTSRLVRQLRQPGTARASLVAIRQFWRKTLGVIQVDTPDVALNMLCNGWLVYQTLACRVWGRSGYYQSGGAFGFRDQLQDVMSLIHADAGLVRAHLLLCASRQFLEGDVQHWWHPPSGRGVRTQCSDDFLWLPLATCHYVVATGDTGVLKESAPFLDGRAVGAGEDSYFDLPLQSGEVASLYQHCVRAISRGLRFGAHGLPLMGSGDWNDGMNLVGAEGKGESIWLGFFLYDVLMRFEPVARQQDDVPFAKRCLAEAGQLRQNLEKHGWDGGWYRRAYFDDGTPLGSAANPECQIDSVSQSWSVLSGAGDGYRSRQAMQALDRRLVRRDRALVQLLDPPFDKSDQDPGYIRGYVPGVRENGGQYTHAAIWAAMAFARLGDAKHAWEILGMINPVNHGNSPETVAIYKGEPYVVAADVYAVSPHGGRAGWTWYTGSAGWMYRLIIESLLGLRLAGDRLHLAPCLPADWPGFRLDYRHRSSTYRIVVRRSADAGSRPGVSVDGVGQPDAAIPLLDDGAEHRVEVVLLNEQASGDDQAAALINGA